MTTLLRSLRLNLSPAADPSGGGSADVPPPAPSGDYAEAFAAIDNIPHDPKIPGGPAEPTPAPAPAPTPAPEPAPAPAPAPAPKAQEAPKDQPKDEFGLDNLDPKPKASAPTKPEPAKPAPKAAEPTKGGIAEFRKQYETTKQEAESLRLKLAEVEKAKEEGIRAEVERTTAALKAEMDAIKKRNEDLESNIRFTDYTKSREYEDKFKRPLEKEWEQVLELIDGATVEGEDGERRQITHADVIELTRMKTGEAAVVAAKVFGPLAASIMQHRNNLVRLTNEKTQAINEWKKNGAQREAEAARQAEERNQRVQRSLADNFSALEKAKPELFGKDESDPEGNTLLDEGDRLIRLAFRGEGVEGRSPEEQESIRLRAQAQVVARARAFTRERLRFNRMKLEVDRLKEELKSLKGSEPEIGGGGGAGDGSAGAGGNEPPESAIDRL